MKHVIQALLVIGAVLVLRVFVERGKDKAFADGMEAAKLDAQQAELDAFEKPLARARDKFAGLHRWLSVLLTYPPFAEEGIDFVGTIQTELGRRFNEDLLIAERLPKNLSIEEEINFFEHCFDQLIVTYSRDIAAAVRNRDSNPIHPGHYKMSKVFNRQFRNN